VPTWSLLVQVVEGVQVVADSNPHSEMEEEEEEALLE